MRTRNPLSDRRYGGDHPEPEPPDSEQDLWVGPSLTITEAARLCGVSVSTIRRHLAAGRFPTAHLQPSPISGQRRLWRIPTQDLLAAGLRPSQAHRPDQAQLLRGFGWCPPGRSDPKHSGPGALYLTRRLVGEGAASHHRSGSDVT